MFDWFFQVVITLLFIIPVTISFFYILQSFTLFRIGVKEKSLFKKKSALRTFFISFSLLIILIMCWYGIMYWFVTKEQEPFIG